MPPHLAAVTNPLTTANLCVVALSGVAFYLVARCVYLLHFHPLARFPGPRLAAVSELWRFRNVRSGRMGLNMRDMHRKYGGVVRVGPNRLSFATVQAFRDIYGHVKHGEKRFLKSKWYELDEPRIVRVRDPVVHAEQRRALSHAFSARALRDQEVVIHHYVDLLMDQISNLGSRGKEPVNMTRAWNWLTFDVIGDLAFGEPFDAITQASNRWVELIFTYLQYSNGRRLAKRLGSLLGPLYLRLAYPAAVRDASHTHQTLTFEKARRRLELGDMGRADFFSHLIKSGKLSESSVVGNSDTLIIAGSETTATTLCGLTWFLLKYPACMSALTTEVRGAFPSIGDITGDATAALPYLHGCIEEALRLFPPVTLGLPRDCPGALVDGQYVPEGTIVSGEFLSMHTDPEYWVDSESFRPERWLGEGLPGDDRRAFQPFSTGPRACLGLNMAYLELRLAVAKMVWLYDLEKAYEVEDLLAASQDFGLWRKPDLLVRFHPRASW